MKPQPIAVFASLITTLASLHAAEADPAGNLGPIRIAKFKGDHMAAVSMTLDDEALCSGTQFHVSKGVHPQEWKTLTTRCVLPPTAGFLVVHIGAGSAGQPGQASPKLGAQFADDIRLTLHTRQNKAELAAR